MPGSAEKPNEGSATERKEAVQAESRGAREQLSDAIKTHNLFRGLEYKPENEKAFSDDLVARLMTFASLPENRALQNEILVGASGKTLDQAFQDFANEYVRQLKQGAETGEKSAPEEEVNAFLEMGPGKVVAMAYKDDPEAAKKIKETYEGKTFFGLLLGAMGLSGGKSFLDGFDKDSIPGKIVSAFRGFLQDFFAKYAKKFGINIEGLKTADVLKKLEAKELINKEVRLSEDLTVPADKRLQVAGMIAGDAFTLGLRTFEAGHAYRTIIFPAGTKIPAGSHLKNAQLLEKELS